jgi:DNA polymerase III delta prime subunit
MGELWPFKYEPKTLNEMIIPNDTRDKFKKIIKDIPNVMLIGPPGVGKGTFTNIFLRETGLDSYKVNCSEETGIDNVRTKIKSFATALGMSPLKVVVLNEIDGISDAAQKMLRDFIESVHKITRFILMCNYSNKVIPELHSRCQVIEMGAPPAGDIFKFCMKILEKEKIEVKNKKEIVDMIKKLYPDIRGIINCLQLNSVNGIIDSIKIKELSNVYDNIISNIISGDLDNVRKILKSRMVDYPDLYSYLYENVDKFKAPGDMIINISEYMYRDSSVAIKEINFMGFVLKSLKQGNV